MLSNELGFIDHRPTMFAEKRIQGVNCHTWDLDAETTKTLETVDLRLEWVQLAGIHAMVKKTWDIAERTEGRGRGVLLADEVGVGKTAQAMGFIAFINQIGYLEENGLP